jgi:hypothetical protein
MDDHNLFFLAPLYGAVFFFIHFSIGQIAALLEESIRTLQMKPKGE